MDSPWDSQWVTDGSPTGHLCATHETGHGSPKGRPWDAHEPPVGRPWSPVVANDIVVQAHDEEMVRIEVLTL